MLNSPISYYGGKKNLLSTILPLIPKHEIYTEAFAGGLAVFFAKEKAKTEIINDTNAFVTIFYKVLVSDFQALKKKISETPYSRAMYTVANSMYKLPHLFSDLQKAWAFYVLTNIGFSCRIGSFGCYTLGQKAHGWERKKNTFNLDLLERLRGTQIECTDALKILSLRNDSSAFHFIDPPYFNSNMGHYGGYTEKDFEDLLGVISDCKGKFLLSSYPSEVLDKYVQENGWYQKEIIQRVSANKTKTGKQRFKTEVLTANYPI